MMHEISDRQKLNLISPGWAFPHLVLHLVLPSPRICQPRQRGYPMAIKGGRILCDNGWMGFGNFEWRVFLKNRWRISVIISTKALSFTLILPIQHQTKTDYLNSCKIFTEIHPFKIFTLHQTPLLRTSI